MVTENKSLDSNTNKKIVKNTSIFAIGSFFSKLVQFLVVPLFTYCFTTEEFGIADLIVSSSTVIIAVVSLCTVESVFRFTLDDGSDKKSVFSNSLLILFFSSIILVGVYLIVRIFNIPFINTYGLCSLSYIILLMFHEVIHYFVKGLEKVGLFVIDAVIYAVLSCCLSLLFVKAFGLGINGYLLGYSLSLIICILFMFVFCKLYRFVGFKAVKKSLLTKMIIYSSPIILNNISWWIMNLSDKYTVLFMMGADSNGILSIVHKVPTVLTLLYTIFSQAFSISAIKDIGLKDENSVNKLSNVFNYLIAANLLLTSIIIFTIKPLTGFLFEESFFDSWKYVPFMMIATIFYCMAAYLGLIYNIKKKNINFGLSTLAGGIINFLICLSLVKYIGLYAASVSTMIADMLIFLIRFLDVRRTVKIKIKPNVIFGFILVVIEPFAYLVPIDYYYSLAIIICLSVLSSILVAKELLAVGNKIGGIFSKKNQEVSSNSCDNSESEN